MSPDPRIPAHAKRVFTGKIFSVWQWEQELFDGSTTMFESVARSDTAQVIATADDRILVLEQEQPARPKFVCIPGGVLDSGKDPLDEAKRELMEETGYASGDWGLWKTFRPSYRIIFTAHYYLARNCRRVADQRLDAGEKIAVRSVSFEEFLALADRDDFRNPELVTLLLRMRIHTEQQEDFRKLLFPTER